jgi:hypothetical protein
MRATKEERVRARSQESIRGSHGDFTLEGTSSTAFRLLFTIPMLPHRAEQELARSAAEGRSRRFAEAFKGIRTLHAGASRVSGRSCRP